VPPALRRFLQLALLLAAALMCLSARADPALLEPFEELRYADDLDGLKRRRLIRALVVYSKTFYFIDRGRERGMVAEGIQRLEQYLNARLKLTRPHQQIHVVAVPVSRDQLIPWLLEGRGDIAAANLTITPGREAQVDFSRAFYSQASEVVVAAKDVAPAQSLEDLSGQEVVVRASSSYYESLEALNRSLSERGLAPVQLTAADERLEDEDLLEMVNAGLIPRIVMDDYKARLWAKVFPAVRIHLQAPLSTHGRIAWAIRKDSPKLKAALDGFVRSNRTGSAAFNDAYQRYFRSTRWVKGATSREELAKFESTVDVFRKYGERYRFDYLLLAAQGYQESGLNQTKVSPVGAVGIMQVMPDTGEAMRVGDISKLDANVHAGTKYLRQLVDVHFAEPQIDELNRALFAFAAYNAGPTRVNQLRRAAARRGLDPNRWFFNVERIASERIGRETVEYVANIFKYYYAYLRVEQQRRVRDELRILGGSEEGQQLLLHRDREHGTLPIPQARTILGL
jgi:membrane-bound lytic murein transglycosylase MltF